MRPLPLWVAWGFVVLVGVLVALPSPPEAGMQMFQRVGGGGATPTATASPTPTPLYDGFYRASLNTGGPCTGGSCWTQKTNDDGDCASGSVCSVDGTTVTILNDAAAPTALEESTVAYFNTATFDTSAYSCAVIGSKGTNPWIGACLGVESATTDAVCCFAVPPGGETYGIHWTDNKGPVTIGGESTGLAWGIGDTIAIERTSATAFRCKYSRAATPTTWVQTGLTTTASFTVNSIASPGYGGVVLWDTSPGKGTIDSWETGPGTLPADHRCGGPMADNFNRSSLTSGGPCTGGSCWTQKTNENGGTNGGTISITGSVAAVSGTNDYSVAYYSYEKVARTASYAMAVAGGSAANGQAFGACLGVTSATNDAVCCKGYNSTADDRSVFSDVWTGTGSGAAVTQRGSTFSAAKWQPGDRIMVVRENSTTYHCEYALAADTAWTKIGSSFTGPSAGTYAGVESTNTSLTVTDWEAGSCVAGRLPGGLTGATACPTDFTQDSALLAYQRFETSPGIVSDSTVGSNNVADNFTNSGVTADTTNFKDGTQSGTFSSTKYATCTLGSCTQLDNIDGANATFTTLCWIRPTSLSATNYIYYVGEGTRYGYQLYTTTAAKVELDILNYSTCTTTFAGTGILSSGTISTNTWAHVGGTSDDVTGRVYINGAQGASASHTAGTCNSDIGIGHAPGYGSSRFPGSIDECVTFSRALSASEVCQLCKWGVDGKRTTPNSECSCTE